MATPTQRWQTIGDALLNTGATQPQLLRLGQSYAYIAGELGVFNAMTNAEKAQYSLAAMLLHMKKQVRKMDSELAAVTAAANAGTAVEAEFVPAP